MKCTLRAASPLICLATFVGTPHASHGQPAPALVTAVVRASDTGAPDGGFGAACAYIDQGLEANIMPGDVMSVYREETIAGTITHVSFMGYLVVSASQEGSAVGEFQLNPDVLRRSSPRHKALLKGDMAVPRLSIDPTLLFEVGSSRFKAEAQAEARSELQQIMEYILMFSPGQVVIEGHTDDSGSEELNQALSEERAQAVADLLLTDYDLLAPGMVRAVGYGESRPIANNVTPEGRARNRRVEIVLWR